MDKVIKEAGKKFSQLVAILKKLRSERGCPWDRVQTEDTIVNYFLEEVYEAVEAVMAQDNQGVKEELGDVLMEIVFLAQIYQEKGLFDISDSLSNINEKMIRRHPHVFGSKKISSPQKVGQEWEKIKEQEKTPETRERVSISPALFQAYQIGLRASRKGFDWEKAQQALAKVKEEIKELDRTVQKKNKEEMREEIGDVLFSLVNVARLLGINPELALRHTNRKFLRRFHYIEKELKKEGKDFSEVDLVYLDKKWEEAKKENS